MLVYVSLTNFCSLLLNFSHILDLGFHHVREKSIVARFCLLMLSSQISLFMRLPKMVSYYLSSLSFSCLVLNSFYPIYIQLFNEWCVCVYIDREGKIGLGIKIFCLLVARKVWLMFLLPIFVHFSSILATFSIQGFTMCQR